MKRTEEERRIANSLSMEDEAVEAAEEAEAAEARTIRLKEEIAWQESRLSTFQAFIEAGDKKPINSQKVIEIEMKIAYIKFQLNSLKKALAN